MRLLDLINDGAGILKNKNIKSYLLDSEILMSQVIEKDRKYVILNSNKQISKKKISLYKELINQRSNGKPISYLIGKKDFWKYEFTISEKVLIPRPETEMIIEQVLKLTKNKSKLNILDIGVGSGCLILSILKEKKDFYGVGIDKSKKCLELSNINALKLNLKNRVKFFNSDIDNFDYGKYDLIISNPPYINKFDIKKLDREVLKYEPRLALYGGLDGTSEIRKVINKSSELIKKNGKFILEIAFDQKGKVEKLLKENGFYINEFLKDFSNYDRCVVCTKI